MSDSEQTAPVETPVEKPAPKYTLSAHKYWMSGIFREIDKFESTDLDFVLRHAKLWIETHGSMIRLQLSVEGPYR